MKTLKELRTERGLTLKQLANAVDYDPGNMSRVETGQYALSAEVAKRLADFYELTLDEVFGREPPQR